MQAKVRYSNYFKGNKVRNPSRKDDVKKQIDFDVWYDDKENTHNQNGVNHSEIFNRIWSLDTPFTDQIVRVNSTIEH